MKIRVYDSKDAEPLANLYKRSVRQIGLQDYSAEQVEAWVSLAPTPERLQALSADGRTMLVAVDDSDHPLAFADLERDGHIHVLYCAPEAAGKGVASALYDKLEMIAREQRMPRLYAEASEVARRFFLRKRFVVKETRRFEIAGVPIHNYAVEKLLSDEVAESGPPPHIG